MTSTNPESTAIKGGPQADLSRVGRRRFAPWLVVAAGMSISLMAVARQQGQPSPQPEPEPAPSSEPSEHEDPPNGSEQPATPPAEAPKPEEKKPEEKKADEKKPAAPAAAPVPEVPEKPQAVQVTPGENGNGGSARVKPAPKEYEIDALGRRIVKGQTTTLAFKSVTVDRIVPFIVESTGKVVLPQQEIMSRKITIINDQPLPQGQALDLVFLALQQNGVAVVETKDKIMLRDIAEIVRQDVPVIGPDSSTLERTDLGTIAEKVYSLKYSTAKSVGEALKDSVPDYAKLVVEEGSNQIVVRGNIGLLQRMERLMDSLDRPSAAALQTETFRLRFADSEQVATNIRDLFEENRQNQQGQQGRAPNNPFGGGAFFGGQQGGGRGGNQGNRAGNNNQNAGNAQAGAVAPSGNLRVTSNKQQNSVTVLAEPGILDQVRKQIVDIWDKPLPEEAVVPRIYDLKNSDPVKVRALLEGLFGTPGSGNASAQSGIGRLAGQFSFEAIPEAGRLVVISKSPDNLFVIDEIIKGIDQPQGIGLPEIVELKHANSEELAQQLNALLSQEGTLAQIDRSASGLSESASGVSPFASTQQSATTDQNGNTTQNNGSTTNAITFWWQRARIPTDNRGTSNLVGKIRIVPVWRQNAVMVMAPTEYRTSVVDLIQSMDKPGRQVLISAIVAEIGIEDSTSLGIRWSSQSITPANADNSLSIGSSTTGTKNDFLGDLFDTSVLNVNTDLNVLLQALEQKSGLSILSEPKIFTSDNQEAEFFDGQDIPFITDSQINSQGNLVQSFDYRAVGLSLRVRPRITINRDVDMRVNLELSSIQQQQTIFGGFIVDRRETTTQLIVQNGQTIVISGILRTEDSDIKRKVPLLGDIPLIGLLFQSTDKVKRQTELVTFITPLVVDNTEKLDDVNKMPRERLKQLRQELGNHDGKGESLPDLTPADKAPLPAEGVEQR